MHAIPRNRGPWFLLLLSLFAGGISAQEPIEKEAARRIAARHEAFNAKSVDELIEDLESHHNWVMVIQRLRILDDKRAIPPLERALEGVKKKSEKQLITAALLSLGARNSEYFEFLAKDARQAARSDMPFPMLVDENGQIQSDQFSPDFLAWCDENKLDPHRAAQRAAYELPGDLSPLIYARDSRATEIFRGALRAPNLFVVAQGITGLAILGDSKSVDQVVRAVKRFPPSSRRRYAAALMLFDDARAHRIAREWVSDEAILKAYLTSYRQMIPVMEAGKN